jgi:hypothetical protein
MASVPNLLLNYSKLEATRNKSLNKQVDDEHDDLFDFEHGTPASRNRKRSFTTGTEEREKDKISGFAFKITWVLTLTLNSLRVTEQTMNTIQMQSKAKPANFYE